MVSRSRLIAQAFGSGGKFRARYLESEWEPNTSAELVVSDNPPAVPNSGELWYNSSNATLYVYYQDGTSNQWVVASPQLTGSPGNDATFSGAISSNILPDTDSAYDLGSPTKKFRSLYLSSDTLYLGDSASISAGSGGEIILPSIKIGTGANAVRLEAGTGGEIVLPSIKIGTGDNAVKLEADAAGKLKTKQITGGVTQAAEEPGNAIVVSDMAGLIAVTGMSTGRTALVTGLNKVFMYNGSAWYLIATMTNSSPTDITGVNSTYSLATDGTATTITAVSTDPEGFPLTWSYATTTGSLGSTATVSQADNVFTITPSSTVADAGTFSITFSVTDGATGAVNAVSAFTLSFENWATPAQEAKLVHPDSGTTGSYGGPEKGFGESVAISQDGNYAVVGSNGQNAASSYGGIYIFNRSGSTWSQQHEIEGNIQSQLSYNYGYSHPRMGDSVAISGDGTVIAFGVPTWGTTNNANPFRGIVFIYTRTGTTWTYKQSFTGRGQQCQFGWSLSISNDGNTIAIGAPQAGVTNTDVGYVSIYLRTTPSGAWSEQDGGMNYYNKILPHTYGDAGWPNNFKNILFGASVDLSNDGNTLVVGQPGVAAGNNGGSAGMAWVYNRSGTTWSQDTNKLQPTEIEQADVYGLCVAISGDGNTIAVGSKGDDDAGYDDAIYNVGAVYVYVKSGGAWSQTHKLYPSGTSRLSASDFGATLSISDDGNTLLIGSRGQGIVYTAIRVSNNWTLSTSTTSITGDDTVVSDQFPSRIYSSLASGPKYSRGLQISGDGTTAIVGSEAADAANGFVDAGAAYIFKPGM